MLGYGLLRCLDGVSDLHLFLRPRRLLMHIIWDLFVFFVCHFVISFSIRERISIVKTFFLSANLAFAENITYCYVPFYELITEYISLVNVFIATLSF